MSIETVDHINDLRRRVLEGEEVSKEELAAAITRIRQDREKAMTKKAAKTAKSAVAKKIESMENLDDLFK